MVVWQSWYISNCEGTCQGIQGWPQRHDTACTHKDKHMFSATYSVKQY